MFTEVNEIVEVAVVFKKNKAVPVLMKWNGRDYKINKVNLIHEQYQGGTLVYCFSVSDTSNSFKLLFNTKNLQWVLEQVYMEG
jgi:hypothetical protein